METPVVSFINMKGGVGKTTLAVHVAYALAAEHAKRVLLVDVDPQFNASTYLMDEEAYLARIQDDKRGTVLDIFQPRREGSLSTLNGVRRGARKKPTLANCSVPVFDDGGRLDLVPSTLMLMEIETAPRQTEERLGRVLAEWKKQYDYVLIDCPPTISIFNQAAVLASSHYVVPLKPDPLSTIGLPLLERWLEEYTDDSGTAVRSAGIVFCMVRSPCPKNMTQIMDDLRQERGDEVFPQHVTQSKDFSDSVERHQPVFVCKSGTKWAGEMLGIAEEFARRVGGESL